MKNETVKAGVKIGASVGVILWFLFGIIAGFHFGGYSAIILMNKLFGQLEPTLIVRAVVVMGATVGIATIGSMCLVVGGLLGGAIGYIVSPLKVTKEVVIKS